MPNATLSARRYVLGLELAKACIKLFGGWVIAIAVLAAALPAIVSQFRSIEISAWYYVASGGQIATAIVAGTFFFALLPTMVAQGMTRRELYVSMGIFGLLWAAIFGTVAAAGFFAEHAYYGALDWNHAIQQDGGDHQLSSFGDVVQTAIAYPLTYVLYFAIGALVGVSTYRWDGGWLVLAPAIPIALAIGAALTGTESWGPGWLRWMTWLGTEADTVVAVAAAVVAVGLAAWLTRLIVVDTPIRAKKP